MASSRRRSSPAPPSPTCSDEGPLARAHRRGGGRGSSGSGVARRRERSPGEQGRDRGPGRHRGRGVRRERSRRDVASPCESYGRAPHRHRLPLVPGCARGGERALGVRARRRDRRGCVAHARAPDPRVPVGTAGLEGVSLVRRRRLGSRRPARAGRAVRAETVPELHGLSGQPCRRVVGAAARGRARHRVEPHRARTRLRVALPARAALPPRHARRSGERSCRSMSRAPRPSFCSPPRRSSTSWQATMRRAPCRSRRSRPSSPSHSPSWSGYCAAVSPARPPASCCSSSAAGRRFATRSPARSRTRRSTSSTGCRSASASSGSTAIPSTTREARARPAT